MLQEDNLFHRITDEHARKVVKDRFTRMTGKKKADEEEEVNSEQSEDYMPIDLDGKELDDSDGKDPSDGNIWTEVQLSQIQ